MVNKEMPVHVKDTVLKVTIDLGTEPLCNRSLGMVPAGSLVGLFSEYPPSVTISDFNAYMGSAFLSFGPWRIAVNSFPGGVIRPHSTPDHESMFEYSVLSGLLRLSLKINKEVLVDLHVPDRPKISVPLDVKFWFRVIEEKFAEGGSPGVGPSMGKSTKFNT